MTTIVNADPLTTPGSGGDIPRVDAWVADAGTLTASAPLAIMKARQLLRRLGVRSGDRVLVRDANSPELVVVIVALALEDVSIALLDARCEQALLWHAIVEARVQWVIGPLGPLSSPDRIDQGVSALEEHRNGKSR